MDELNPFSRHADSDDAQIEGARLAQKFAAAGATHGAIVQKLRAQGLHETTCNRLAAHAVQRQAFKKRLTGLALIGAGVVLVLFAWALTTVMRWKLPIMVAMFGLLFCGLGIANLFHRSRRKPNGKRIS